MALITGNTTRRKSLSILASDLAGNVNFDASKTIGAMDIASDKYNEGMSLYLQTLGVNKLDAEYNAAVKHFELQLEEQELAAKLQANLAADSAANLAVEAQPGLGTGAAAVASAGRQSALDDAKRGIEQSVTEAYQEGITSIAEEYQSKLESILGEYDPVTGTFAELSNYEQLSNKVNEAMAKVMALIIDPSADTMSDAYLEILKGAGFIENSAVPGEVVLTDLGKEQIDMLVNSVNANEARPEFGGNSLGGALALQMAMADYSGYLDDGTPVWSSLSSTKRAELVRKYESWIYNNQENLRLTAWDLYTKTDEGFELDISWTTPVLDSTAVGVYTDKGTYITQLTVKSESNPNGAADCTEEELAATKLKILRGEIPDGAYFTFQSGEMYGDDKYYYVKDNTVFETEYTAENPPPVISVESATVRSFGIYSGTGTGDKQDKWAQTIIDAAKAGRIPDGTYIRFNYNLGNYEDIYIFESGIFRRLTEADTLISLSGTSVNALDYIARNHEFRRSDEFIDSDYGWSKYFDWED